ncbi:carboxymuconolactone decarboxylase family protein [Craurococcus roseus]|uniref:Carboxymuconolactone decarboxylase family protein n=1 Tax=Craurococcus roseus TaxID=77585 RepID=A0ABN1FNA0_9PROT
MQIHAQRLDYPAAAPEAYRAMLALTRAVKRSGLEERLVELVFLRCSQINGCAFCLDMHGAALRKAGEAPARLDMIAGWREAGPVFAPRERAALALAEALTRLADRGDLPDPVYAEAREHFSEAEIANLGFAVAAINGWNRLAVAFRATPLSVRQRPAT